MVVHWHGISQVHNGISATNSVLQGSIFQKLQGVNKINLTQFYHKSLSWSKMWGLWEGTQKEGGGRDENMTLQKVPNQLVTLLHGIQRQENLVTWKWT